MRLGRGRYLGGAAPVGREYCHAAACEASVWPGKVTYHCVWNDLTLPEVPPTGMKGRCTQQAKGEPVAVTDRKHPVWHLPL